MLRRQIAAVAGRAARPAVRRPTVAFVRPGLCVPRQYGTATPRRAPTLGPLSRVKITNPAHADDGSVLAVTVTDRAAEKLNEIKKKDSNPNEQLRISVESGGCHGFQYVFQLQQTDTATEDDAVFELDGARFVIDHASLELLRDSQIDYTTELIGSQFKVSSPHAKSACGCGTSFSFEPEN